MDDKFWAKIEFTLSEIRDLLRMQIESQEDAVGKRIAPRDAKKHKNAVWKDGTSRWNDETNDDGGHDVAVRPWLLIPYVDAIDQDMLKERMETGKRLLTSVEQRVAARELSTELLHEWGLLRSCAGALEIIYHARPDVGDLRRGSNNLDAHRYWFARRFLRIYRRGAMDDARDVMEYLINSRINALPAGPGRDWLERFLSDLPSLRWENARRLTGEFRDDLSVVEMRRIIKQPPPSDIPNLKIPLP